MSANISIFVPHSGCPHKCSFCDQNAITGKHSLPSAADVTATVEKGLEYINDPKSTEIAFFGGSFTAIDRAYMTELLDAAFPFVKSGRVKGIRVSTRPDAVDDEILDALESRGVCAVELGAQSMDNDVLEKNLRGHTAEQVESAAELIKSRGFELGLQMMTGLYASNREKDIKTAQRLAFLCPDTVRIYPAVTLENTLLCRLYKSGKYFPPSLDETVSLCAELLEFFEHRGIKVIKLGLHASKEVESSYAAGPYHPAFRELCEGKIYLKKAVAALGGQKGDFTLYVAKSEISKMTGQSKCNLKELEKLGCRCKIKPRDGLEKFRVIAEKELTDCF